MLPTAYFQDAVGLFQNITDQYNGMENRKVQPDTNTKKEQRKSIFQTVVAFEKFALKYSYNRLAKSAPQINITNSKLCKWKRFIDRFLQGHYFFLVTHLS